MHKIIPLFIFLSLSACGGGGSDAVETAVTDAATKQAEDAATAAAAKAAEDAAAAATAAAAKAAEDAAAAATAANRLLLRKKKDKNLINNVVFGKSKFE